MATDHSRPPAPIWRQQASSAWYEGALLGNGDLGVVVFGSSDTITYAIGKNDFWDRRCYIENPDATSFQQYMELIRRGTPPELSIDFGPVTPKPACRVEISTGSAKRPRHALNLETAELATTSPGLKITSRVQKDWNLVVLNIPEGATVVLRRPPDSTNMGIEPPTHKLEDNTALIIQDMPGERTYPDGFRCATAARMIGDCEVELSEDRIAWRTKGNCELLLAVATTRDDPEPVSAAKATLGSADDTNPREEHLRLWKQFWDASWIKIDDEQIECLWYIHNYLLACASRPGAVAPGLFGPWIVEDVSAWQGSYVTDYNFEQAFAAALSCNHADLLESYLETVEEALPAARHCAREVFESDGVAFPHQMYPIEMSGRWHPSMVYVCETPWVVQHFWERYEYTRDEEFLRKRAYPVISECADFLASYAVHEGNGNYAFQPTRSPEHHGLQQGLPFNRNGTPELAMAGYTFRAALAGAEIVGDDPSRTGKWREVLAGLPDYPRMDNQLGQIYLDCEATPPEGNLAPPVDFTAMARPSKRPGNHGAWMTYNFPTSLFPIWPGSQVDMDSDPDELLTAIRTWFTLKCEGSNELITRHMCAARLGIPTLNELKREIAPRLMPNGSITCMMNPLFEGQAAETMYMYRANGIYTENFAFPLVINEMMLQSHNGVIKLFPTMDYYRKAEFHGLRARGGFAVSAAMDRGFVLRAEIQATVNGECRVRLPWPEYAVSVASSGKPHDHRVEGKDIVFRTTAGAQYALSPSTSSTKGYSA